MRWISEEAYYREDTAKKRTQLACEQLRRFCRVKLRELADMKSIAALIKEKFDIEIDRASWLISAPMWSDRPTPWMRRVPIAIQKIWDTLGPEARLVALYTALLASEGEV